MAHNNTVFLQLLKLIPRHEFETLAKHHHSGRSFRTATRWSQFVTMAMAQLSGRNSLRDIVENMSAQIHRLYHLGIAKLTRSNLSRINEAKPFELYAVMTQIWIALCIYLLLAFIKFQSKISKSMQQILRLLQLNLFEKRELMALLRDDPIPDRLPNINQMTLL